MLYIDLFLDELGWFNESLVHADLDEQLPQCDDSPLQALRQRFCAGLRECLVIDTTASRQPEVAWVDYTPVPTGGDSAMVSV
jgi:hypothetical protein